MAKRKTIKYYMIKVWFKHIGSSKLLPLRYTTEQQRNSKMQELTKLNPDLNYEKHIESRYIYEN